MKPITQHPEMANHEDDEMTGGCPGPRGGMEKWTVEGF